MSKATLDIAKVCPSHLDEHFWISGARAASCVAALLISTASWASAGGSPEYVQTETQSRSATEALVTDFANSLEVITSVKLSPGKVTFETETGKSYDVETKDLKVKDRRRDTESVEARIKKDTSLSPEAKADLNLQKRATKEDIGQGRGLRRGQALLIRDLTREEGTKTRLQIELFDSVEAARAWFLENQ